eukprot:16255415-Heterocapsa_arctica.AAC.1
MCRLRVVSGGSPSGSRRRSRGASSGACVAGRADVVGGVRALCRKSLGLANGGRRRSRHGAEQSSQRHKQSNQAGPVASRTLTRETEVISSQNGY